MAAFDEKISLNLTTDLRTNAQKPKYRLRYCLTYTILSHSDFGVRGGHTNTVDSFSKTSVGSMRD